MVRTVGRADFLGLPGVVAVETSRSGELWAATLGDEDPPAPGTIVKITGGKAYSRPPCGHSLEVTSGEPT